MAVHSKTMLVYFAIPKVNRASAYPTAQVAHIKILTSWHWVVLEFYYLDRESIPVDVDLSSFECQRMLQT